MRNKKATKDSNWYKKSKKIFSNYEQDYVLVGIPKCAFNTLRDCLPLPDKFGHYSYDFIFNHHGLTPDDYKKITFTRNPWDRMVSWFYFHKTNGIQAFKYTYFDNWVKDGCPHSSWDLPVSYYHPENPLNMHEWMGGDPDNMDFIGSVENIEEDLERLAEELGITIPKPKHLNTSNHKKYQEIYTDETKAIVAEVFSKDIEAFNYKF